MTMLARPTVSHKYCSFSTTMLQGSRSSLEHLLGLDLDLRQLGRNEIRVQRRCDRGIPRPLQHGRELPGLELFQGPREGVRYQRRVPEDALVFTHRSIVIVRVGAEAVKGQQLDLLPGDIAQDMDGDPSIRSHGAHL